MKSINSNSNSNYNWIWITIIVLFVIIIIAFGCWSTTDHFKQTFGNLMNNNIKDLDITMFMIPTCQWCQKTLALFEKEGIKDQIEIIDISTPQGAEYASKTGADKQPVPSFISKKMKTGHVGYSDDINELIKALKQPKITNQNIVDQDENQYQDENKYQNQDEIINRGLNITMFAREGCGWCDKAKSMINESNYKKYIHIVDTNTPQGQELYRKLLPEGSGNVPAFVNITNNKYVIGYKPIDKIISELS